MVASLFSTSVSISQEFVKQGEYGTLYFRDIDVHITDIKKDMVWGDTNQETLSTTSVSRVEYTKGSVEDMWKMVEEKIIVNTKLVLDGAKEKGISPRKYGMDIAKERVLAKCDVCKV